MTHAVVRPFYSPDHGRILQRGESFKHEDPSRVKDLEQGKLIAPQEKQVARAPSNKDAASKRKNK